MTEPQTAVRSRSLATWTDSRGIADAGERLGYKLIGEIPNYLVSGSSEFLMRKTIAPIREFTPAR